MNVIDNSGALLVECIRVLKGGSHARIGDEIVCVVQKARPMSAIVAGSVAAMNKVRQGDIRRAIIVRTKKETRRGDGRYIRFDDNACILINEKKEPLGSRINGMSITI